MNVHIIDPKRYKKTTKKRSKIDKEIKRKTAKKEIRNDKININDKFQNIFIKENKAKKIQNNNGKRYFLILKISFFVFVMIGISYISRIIVGKYNKNISDAITTSKENGDIVTLLQDSSITIGLNNVDSLDVNKTKNILINEVNSMANLSLIEFDNEYNIIYKVAKNIEKINNKEYIITLDKNYKVDSEKIKKSVDIIKSIGDSNIYFYGVNKIDKIENVDNENIKILLKEENPYFVYYLNFPIFTDEQKYKEYITNLDVSDQIKYSRNEYKSTVSDIIIKNYNDIDNLISDFRENKIDIFTASSDSIMSLVGKHDYIVKKYRDGKSLFLLGNPNSSIYSIKEVRKAILYSINRDKIIKELNTTFVEKIDIPYIYSDIKYKYDTYGAQNVLQSQGWVKKQGIYTKKIYDKNVNIEITILVKSDDGNKIKIAEIIKNMIEENGIKVNINAKSGDEFNNSLKKGEYDLVLADVYINNIPDISFIEKYLSIGDIATSAINIVKNSTIDELPKNIRSLKEIISNEVVCIGIYATNTNVVCQSNLTGFSNVGYLNIFNKFEKIGKVQKTGT